MKTPSPTGRHKGFTIVELLVVITIISVLIAMLLPAISAAKVETLKVTCAGNMRQMGLALVNYSTNFKGRIPTLNPLATAVAGTSFPTNRPFQIDKVTVYDQLIAFGASSTTIRCPAMKDLPSPVGVTGGNDMFTSLQLVAGLADPAVRAINENTLGPYGAQAAKWYDTNLSASTLDIDKDPSKLLIVDLNMFLLNDNGLSAMTGGPAYLGPNINWLYSNHAEYNLSNPSTSQISTIIRGSNRFHADGHGEWVKPNVMGRNNTQITSTITNARYSFYADQRPMYW